MTRRERLEAKIEKRGEWAAGRREFPSQLIGCETCTVTIQSDGSPTHEECCTIEMYRKEVVRLRAQLTAVEREKSERRRDLEAAAERLSTPPRAWRTTSAPSRSVSEAPLPRLRLRHADVMCEVS